MTEAEWMACADPRELWDYLESRTHLYRTDPLGWLSPRPVPMSERKRRLFCCACVSRIAHLLPTEASRRCVAMAERYADRLADDAELDAAVADSIESCWADRRRRAQAGSPWRRFEAEAVNAVGRVHRTDAAGRGDVLAAAVEAWAEAAVRAALTRAHQEADAAPTADDAAREMPAKHGFAEARAAERKAEEGRQAALLRCIFGNPFRSVPTIKSRWLAWNDGTVHKLAAAIYEDRRFADLSILADALEDAGCEDAAILAHCRGPGEHGRGCWVVDLLTGRV
jgi:hypothetical protein